MNRTTTLAMFLIMGLLLFWSSTKQKEAQRAHEAKAAQQKADSLAKVKASGLDTASVKGPAQSGASAILSTVPTDSAKAGDSTVPGVAQRTLVVETQRMTVTLDNLGARVTGLSIAELHGKKPANGRLITAEKGGAFALILNNQDLSKQLWEMEFPESDLRDGKLMVKDKPATVTFRLRGPSGELARVYTFHPDSNGFGHALKTASAVESYTLKWPSGLEETEQVNLGKGFGLNSSFFSEVVFDNGVTVMREAFDGKQSFNEESGSIRWAGLRRKYVAAVMDFGQETHHKITATGRTPEGKDDDFPKEYELVLSGHEFEEKALDFTFLLLPLSYGELKAHNLNYEKIIFSGWEWFFRADIWYVGLCGLVLNLLKGFHDMIPNWGVAIILLTLLVRLATFPLTIAQTKAGVRMAQHAPAIQKIRERNKGNNQKASMEIMEYYKKEGINPMAQVMGCFPVLLQMPIFISLFNVLGRAVELKDAPFIGWITDLSMPDVVLPALKIPFLFPLGFTILPFLMAFTMWVQMKMSIKDPNQKMLVWMMPIMMFIFSCSFPSGLVLYWTVSNIFTIGQTYFYTNRLTKNATPAGAGPKANPPPGGKALPAQTKPVKPKPAKT